MDKNSTLQIVELYSKFKTNPYSILDKIFTVNCHVINSRVSKIGFIECVDGSTIKHLQAVCDPNSQVNGFFDKLFEHLHIGVALELTGKIVKSPKAAQPFEMQVQEYKCFGGVREPATYLFSAKNDITLEVLRQNPHLRYKSKIFMAVEIIKKEVFASIHEFFRQNGFGEVRPTALTTNSCEGGAQEFTVTSLLKNKVSEIPILEDKDSIDYTKDFFKKQIYLTVSSQLHLEAVTCATGNSYCMTTAFRAEPSTGLMHLAEFCMPEWEMRFGSLEDNMSVAERLIKHCIKNVLEKCFPELEFLQTKFDETLISRLYKYASEPFYVITHEKCVKMMLQHVQEGKANFEVLPKYDDDLTREHEKYITKVLGDNQWVFVCAYPKRVKSFYMNVINKGDEIERVDNYDLLADNLGEVVGGSQRIWQYDELVERMNECEINREPLEWYLDLRKYGSVPHGGAGLGLSRLLLMLTGMQNIRDMEEFPRSYGSCLF